MTYQLTMCGCDGIVMASDRRELRRDNAEQYVASSVTKICTAGTFAWAYSGGELGPVFSRHLHQKLKQRLEELAKLGSAVVPDEDALEDLKSCGAPACNEWRHSASGPGGESTIVIASGKTGRIHEATISLEIQPSEKTQGWHVSGQKANLAVFVPTRFYSRTMCADELATLAAYSIRAAHDIDSRCIGGLDIAIFRNNENDFRLLPDPELYANRAAKLDEAVRKSLNL
jgi:hypothetical protein